MLFPIRLPHELTEVNRNIPFFSCWFVVGRLANFNSRNYTVLVRRSCTYHDVGKWVALSIRKAHGHGMWLIDSVVPDQHLVKFGCTCKPWNLKSRDDVGISARSFTSHRRKRDSSKENQRDFRSESNSGQLWGQVKSGWNVVIKATMTSTSTVLYINWTLCPTILLLLGAGLILTLLQPFNDHPKSHGSLAPAKKPSKFHWLGPC